MNIKIFPVSYTHLVDEGATLVLDGRNVKVDEPYQNGFFVGPTILDNVKPGMTVGDRAVSYTHLKGSIHMVMDIKEIMEIIPHRQPFLLIDRIEELEPGKRAVGKKCVTYNEPFFNGHFPQEPVMPGVLILEALAQTGAVAILSPVSYTHLEADELKIL